MMSKGFRVNIQDPDFNHMDINLHTAKITLWPDGTVFYNSEETGLVAFNLHKVAKNADLGIPNDLGELDA